MSGGTGLALLNLVSRRHLSCGRLPRAAIARSARQPCFCTDEKPIRTETRLLVKPHTLGLLLSKIVDCARMCFSSVRNQRSARTVSRPRNIATSQQRGGRFKSPCVVDMGFFLTCRSLARPSGARPLCGFCPARFSATRRRTPLLSDACSGRCGPRAASAPARR